MSSYEDIIRQQLGLQPLILPNALLKPLQCHILRDGRPFGRFALSDVFSGEFSGVEIGAPATIADLKRTLSQAYSVKGNLGGAAPLSGLQKAGVALESAGARKLVLTSIAATLQECDQGQLHYALANAEPFENSPLRHGDVALVIVGVAALTALSLQIETETGAKLDANAALAGDVAANLGIAAERRSDGGLTVTYPSPLPFAARVWRVRRRRFPAGLKIDTPDATVGVLGPQCSAAFRSEEALDLWNA